MARGWRLVVLAATAAWGAALAYSTFAARVLYGDGAWYVLVHLQNPLRFNDYDAQRSFASFISQAPVLLGQRLGLESVASYAALYSVGVFVLPAAAMLAALVLSRRQPLLFAANMVAIVVYGFGINFINSEANLLLGLAWLCMTVMAMEGTAPFLRGFVLPLLAVALLRTYEGMLLVGPILALWAFTAAGRTVDPRERLGLLLSAMLFFLGAVIGFGGFLSPRDPRNAAGFASSVLLYLRNPQVFLFLSALLAATSFAAVRPRVRLAAAAMSAILGAAYLVASFRLQGFYAYDVYYNNRAFVVLSLPAFAAALFAAWHWRPDWLARGPHGGHAVLLVPLGFAVAGDMLGTYRWGHYVKSFCSVLDEAGSPAERLARLQQSGSMTAWSWTHPTMSVLLHDRGSGAMVMNEPAQRWEPFPVDRAPYIDYWGLCQAPLIGHGRERPDALMISFTSGRYPPAVAEIRGVSAPEGWGTWSEGPRVEVRFKQPLPPSFDLAVRLGTAFGSNRELPVKVRVGDKEQTFVPDRDPFQATLQFRGVGGERGSLFFEIPKPESPLERGSGQDPRKLGIGLISLVVTPR